MGWFSGSNSSDNNNSSSSSKQESSGKADQLLEDLPPKFEDNVNQAQANREFEKERRSTTLKEAWHSLQWKDFQSMTQVPCFRQSLLTGGAVAGVAFAVLVSTRNSVKRGANWAMVGFLFGSIVSWEQCRFKMRRGLRNTELAKDHYKTSSQKPKPE